MPKTVREMTQLLRETQKNGDTQTNQKAQMNTKLKPSLNTQKNTRPNRTVWTGPGSCTYWKLPMYSLNARDHFNWSLLLFLWPAPRNRCGETEGEGGPACKKLIIGVLLLMMIWLEPCANVHLVCRGILAVRRVQWCSGYLRLHQRFIRCSPAMWSKTVGLRPKKIGLGLARCGLGWSCGLGLDLAGLDSGVVLWNTILWRSSS